MPHQLLAAPLCSPAMHVQRCSSCPNVSNATLFYDRSPWLPSHSLPAAAEAAAARRRAAAMCQIAGVGEVGSEQPHPAAMQAAMNEVRSGAAYRDSPYADGVADLVRPHQGSS